MLTFIAWRQARRRGVARGHEPGARALPAEPRPARPRRRDGLRRLRHGARALVSRGPRWSWRGKPEVTCRRLRARRVRRSGRPGPRVISRAAPPEAAPPAPRACAASPGAAGARARDRPGAARPSGRPRSSWSRSRRGRSAAPAPRSPGQGCPYRPWTAIPSRKAVTFSGKASARLGGQPLGPLAENRLGGGVETLDLRVAQLVGHPHRRQAGPMQDLVRVGVADAVEEARVREGTLQRVSLPG